MTVKIGEVLVSQSLVTPDQVDKALTYQKKHGGKLGSVMVELGFVSDKDLAKALSTQLHIPSATSEEFRDILPTAIKMMDGKVVKKYGCVPLLMRERLRVAISDPWEIKAINEWALREDVQVQLVIAPEIWITAAMERYYKISRENRYQGVPEEHAPLVEEEMVIHPLAMDPHEEPESNEEVIELEETSIVEDLPFSHFQKLLAECRSIEEVFDALLAFLSPVLPQIAVYVARKGMFLGWVLHGFPARPSEFSKIRIPMTEDSPLRTIAELKTPLRTSVNDRQFKLMGFDLLQINTKQGIQFLPLLFRGQVSACLMALSDRAGSKLHPSHEKQVRLACAKTEAALEMLVYRRIILAPPTA